MPFESSIKLISYNTFCKSFCVENILLGIVKDQFLFKTTVFLQGPADSKLILPLNMKNGFNYNYFPFENYKELLMDFASIL